MAALIGVFVASWLVAFVAGRFVYRRISGKLQLPMTAFIVSLIIAPGVVGGHGFAIVPLPVAIYETGFQVVQGLLRFHAISFLVTFAVVFTSCLIGARLARR